MAGPIKPDMELQREVRRLTLKKIRAILIADKDDDLSRAVLLKLAGTVLPRINEHMGENGEAIIIQVSKEGAEKYGISTSGTSSNTD